VRLFRCVRIFTVWKSTNTWILTLAGVNILARFTWRVLPVCARFLQPRWASRKQGRIQGGRLGQSPPLKPTKVTFFTMIFYNLENSIRDIRPFSRPLFCHSSVVKYTSCLLQLWTRNETWLPNITEIAPFNLLAGCAPGRNVVLTPLCFNKLCLCCQTYAVLCLTFRKLLSTDKKRDVKLNVGHVFCQILTVTSLVGSPVEMKIVFPPAQHDFLYSVPLNALASKVATSAMIVG